MSRSVFHGVLVVAAVSIFYAGLASGQDKAAAPPKGFRKLAAGVETTIPPKFEAEDTFSRHPFNEVLAVAPADWTPNFEPPSATLQAMAKGDDGLKKGPPPGMLFHGDVWYLEFTFRPLRTILVDIPKPTGGMEKKLIWYMIYRVRNPGKHLHPVTEESREDIGPDNKPRPDKTHSTPKIELVDRPIFWFPKFTIVSTIRDKRAGTSVEVTYPDKVIPVALEAIRKKEDPNRTFLNCAEMSQAAIEVGTEEKDNSVYGIACWSDVDLRIDFFTIFVHGLTNAYRWQDPKEGIKATDKPGTGRKFVYKELELNFWRPGDELHPNDQEIYYGAPGQVDFRWVYR